MGDETGQTSVIDRAERHLRAGCGCDGEADCRTCELLIVVRKLIEMGDSYRSQLDATDAAHRESHAEIERLRENYQTMLDAHTEATRERDEAREEQAAARTVIEYALDCASRGEPSSIHLEDYLRDGSVPETDAARTGEGK